MDRRGNASHFEGAIINVAGPIETLAEFGDKELDYIAGIEIISAEKTGETKGKIILQARKHAQERVISAARKFELEVS